MDNPIQIKELVKKIIDEAGKKSLSKRKNKTTSKKGKIVPFNRTYIDHWSERDRAYIILYEKGTEKELFELWDDAVSDAISDGFIDPRNLHRSTYEYYVHLNS